MELKKLDKFVDEIKEKIKKLREQYYAGKTEVEIELRKLQKELKTKVKDFSKG